MGEIFHRHWSREAGWEEELTEEKTANNSPLSFHSLYCSRKEYRAQFSCFVVFKGKDAESALFGPCGSTLNLTPSSVNIFFKKQVLRLTIHFKELNTFLKHTMHFWST